jgi:hypothetical protein
MGNGNVFAEAIVCEVALTTTTFSANIHDSIVIPYHKALVNAAHHEKLMLETCWVCKDLLDPIVIYIDSDSSS